MKWVQTKHNVHIIITSKPSDTLAKSRSSSYLRKQNNTESECITALLFLGWKYASTPETLRGMLNQIMLLLSRQKNSLRPPFLINTNISLLIKKYKKVFFLLAPTEERKNNRWKSFNKLVNEWLSAHANSTMFFFLFGAITSSWLPWNKFQDYDMSWRRTQLCWSVKPIIKWNLLRKKDVNIFWPFSVSVPKNLSQFFN